MKLLIKFIVIASFFLASCSSMKTAYVYDDLYNSPNDMVASNLSYNVSSSSDNVKTEELSLDEKLNNLLKDTSVQDVDTVIYTDEYENPYDRVLVDDYATALERRRKGIEDPYYRINNLSVYFSDDYWYASAYDPSYYNMVIMGSQVWVEPRYISSSFGFSYGYRYNSYPYYGYGWPSSYFGYNPYSYYGYSPYSSYYGYPYNYWGYDNYYTNNYFRKNPTSINRRRGIGGYSNYISSSRAIPEVHTATSGRKSSTIDKQEVNNHNVRRGVVANSDTKKNDRVRRNNLSNTQIAKDDAVRRRTSNYTRPAGTSSTYNTNRRTRTTNYNNANKKASTTNNRYSRPRRSVSTNSNNSNTRSTYNRGSSSKSNYSKSNTSNNSSRSNSNRSSSSYSGSSNSGSSSSKSSSSSSSSTTRRSGRR